MTEPIRWSGYDTPEKSQNCRVSGRPSWLALKNHVFAEWPAKGQTMPHPDDSGPSNAVCLRRCDPCRLANSVRDLGRQYLHELEGRIRRRS